MVFFVLVVAAIVIIVDVVVIFVVIVVVIVAVVFVVVIVDCRCSCCLPIIAVYLNLLIVVDYIIVSVNFFQTYCTFFKKVFIPLLSFQMIECSL